MPLTENRKSYALLCKLVKLPLYLNIFTGTEEYQQWSAPKHTKDKKMTARRSWSKVHRHLAAHFCHVVAFSTKIICLDPRVAIWTLREDWWEAATVGSATWFICWNDNKPLIVAVYGCFGRERRGWGSAAKGDVEEQKGATNFKQRCRKTPRAFWCAAIQIISRPHSRTFHGIVQYHTNDFWHHHEAWRIAYLAFWLFWYSEYPKFSGKAKDWIVFERKFRSVASSHCLDYVLQDEPFEPSESSERE